MPNFVRKKHVPGHVQGKCLGNIGMCTPENVASGDSNLLLYMSCTNFKDSFRHGNANFIAWLNLFIDNIIHHRSAVN